jgi:hypothetical protein
MCKADMLDEMPDAVFLCVVPDQYQEMDLHLTPAVEDKFPVVERALLQEMTRLGVVLEK